jgi:hypothetical protein
MTLTTDEWIKIIVDKLFLAIVVVAFGFYFSRLLERFRTRLSFSTELNKTRVSKIAEIWEKLYEFELLAEMSKRTDPNNHSRFEKLFSELHALMERNRFWIGDSAFKEINSYKVLLKNLTEACDEAIAKSLREEVDKSKQNVTKVRDHLLEGKW